MSKSAMQELIKIMGVYYTKALMQPEDEKSFAIKAVLYEIMKKIDDELLEKEKEQIIEARDGRETSSFTTGKDYYDLNFNHHIESEPNSYTNFTPHNANAVAEYNKWLKNFTSKQINKMETPLENLMYYFRNNDTITKEELYKAINELYDNERAFCINAFEAGILHTKSIPVDSNAALEYYNLLYKTN